MQKNTKLTVDYRLINNAYNRIFHKQKRRIN